jgi:hypothetical protein
MREGLLPSGLESAGRVRPFVEILALDPCTASPKSCARAGSTIVAARAEVGTKCHTRGRAEQKQGRHETPLVGQKAVFVAPSNGFARAVREGPCF